MWKIGRKSKSVLAYKEQCEDLITKLLDKAKERAEGLEGGEKFEVSLDPAEIPPDAHYIEIVGPVMMRARAYGLRAGTCFDWTFEFTKI